jgi:hypothetical protein
MARGKVGFRFMGRDPVTPHVKLQERVHLVDDRGQPSLCGLPWPVAVNDQGGWLTRAELKSARFPPPVCNDCHDVLWGVRRRKDPADPK